MPNKDKTQVDLVSVAADKGSRELDAMLGAYLCLCTLDYAARARVLQWLPAALRDYCPRRDDEPPF